MKIKKIWSHKILNSRADWTIKTYVMLSDGTIGTASVPEGASKGENEAISIAVDKAVANVNTLINRSLSGMSVNNQRDIDEKMIDMDGSANKKNLGANSILSVSLAVANAAAQSKKIPLFAHIAELFELKAGKKPKFPTPIFNVLNGGKHSSNNLSFQEFMIIPSPEYSFEDAYKIGVDIYHTMIQNLLRAGQSVAVGDEGGFAPDFSTTRAALKVMKNSAKRHLKVGENVFFGLDVASGSFYKNGLYSIAEEELELTSNELALYYKKLIKDFELIYIEDPFYEKDFGAWSTFNDVTGVEMLVVGDDLVVTNKKILQTAVNKNLCNAVIVKPNQIGTLSETLDFVKLAQKNNMSVVISHRSGETAEDVFIADLSIGVGADFIKSGAPARGERVVKYNRLLEIFYSLSS